MKRDVIRILTTALVKIGAGDISRVEVEIPPKEDMGDLASPVAMSLPKVLKRPPRQIAEEIILALSERDIFERIEIAGPGFINFTFSREYLLSSIKNLLANGSAFLREDIGKGKSVQIEFVSANPTGPLHLGHGRGAATGAALANLLKASGHEVAKEYYINDAGRQVRLLGLSVFARYLELLGEEFPFPDEGYRGDYVRDIAAGIVGEKGNTYVGSSFETASAFFIDYSYRTILSVIEKDLLDFGIAFDSWQSERALYESGSVQECIDDLRQKDAVYEKDGALWFRATAFGDDKDRVMIKGDGEFTYFTSDISYHRQKIERKYDELIDIWGADHHGYIPRIQAVIEALGYRKEKLKVLLVQMVALLRGGKPVQMSKRSGDFVSLREVMDEVGADTTKFIFLTRRPDSHLEFDLEVAKSQSAENPVFYVQYANARISNIFSHAAEKGIESGNLQDIDLEPLVAPEELRLMRKLLSYPMVFSGAAESLEPHRITFYLQELAGLFHPYYNKYRVVTEDISLSSARLALCGAVRTVLRDGLDILGISAPERM